MEEEKKIKSPRFAVDKRRRKKLAAFLNAAIKELYDDGTLAKLADKYNLSGRIIAQ